MTQADIERLCEKVKALDADDPVRRGIEELAGKWLVEGKESRRERIEREIQKRAQRLAY